ncbi:hypothetical protein WMY93_017373 [Mugilogobius chulae]|uniref:Uncharacterized protein n=1 Tax=Mugilogobius chulae TaxID=88201 RepID=A0AAW0NZM3_9GOBI
MKEHIYLHEQDMEALVRKTKSSGLKKRKRGGLGQGNGLQNERNSGRQAFFRQNNRRGFQERPNWNQQQHQQTNLVPRSQLDQSRAEIKNLRKKSKISERILLKQNQEAICQCEKSFQELEDLKKTQNQLQEQLKRAENDASFFKNQLDIFFNEREEILSDTNRLRATTNQYVVTNKDLRDENCRLHEKYQREIKVLREQLRKEQQKSGNLQASLSKTQHQTAQMKELESLVEDLKLKFNEEKSEKRKGKIR